MTKEGGESIIVRVVSFASEGPPHDAGLPIAREEDMKIWENACLEGGATTFKYFTPRSLPEDEKWCVRNFFESKHAIRDPNNPNYNNVGLGAWRSVILRKTFDESRDGDVVVLHDPNFRKYPHTIAWAKSLRQFVVNALMLTDFFMPPHAQSNDRFCASEVFRELIPDDIVLRNKIEQVPHHRIRLMIFKVNDKTRNFIKVLEQTMKEKQWLLSPSDKTSTSGRPWGFHTADQAVINVLACREGLIPIDWKGSWIEKIGDAGNAYGSGMASILNIDKFMRGEIPPFLYPY